MAESYPSSFELFDDNLQFFTGLVRDIRQATKYIYLETYRFSDDAIGHRVKDALLEKAKEGLEIKLLVDAYGTKPAEFLNELAAAGVQLRFFKKMKFFISNAFAKNNTRNHRKLVLIDDHITYIGSSNITAYALNWRDLNLRMDNPITRKFKGCFLHNYAQYKFYELAPFERIKLVRYHGFGIVQDTPTSYFQTIRNYMLKLIENAKEEILFETPYFLPGHKIRKALANAAKRGVKVVAHVPLHSDVSLVDILRNKYLGPLHKAGIQWKFYTPDLLHAKCMLIDRKRFFMGSANMDYRSFRYQYEIMLYGENPEIIGMLQRHIDGTEAKTVDFDYEKWLNTPKITRFMEWLLMPFRHLF
ncbi:MAG: phosphatidylserine/phosphatidylglycerophosphate/cardiolipin synthase family protein [Bacteroidales bacterium]|nr:phosphatidylserine/phosphatidylglycerophosphate/cardiolipin synthase family protein [Bacteroidales bacterium]